MKPRQNNCLSEKKYAIRNFYRNCSRDLKAKRIKKQIDEQIL